MYYGVFWVWTAVSIGPTSFYTFFIHFLCLVGYLCTGWGAGITGSASTLSGEYPFPQIGSGEDALNIVLGVGANGMVTDYISTFGCGWVLFWVCSTILVCVSVVSSLVFGVIWPWNISESFRSALSFSVTKGANCAAGAKFFSALIKYIVAWVSVFVEEIPGILLFPGDNFTMTAISSAFVLEM